MMVAVVMRNIHVYMTTDLGNLGLGQIMLKMALSDHSVSLRCIATTKVTAVRIFVDPTLRRV
jgi:hypothetical protein